MTASVVGTKLTLNVHKYLNGVLDISLILNTHWNNVECKGVSRTPSASTTELFVTLFNDWKQLTSVSKSFTINVAWVLHTRLVCPVLAEKLIWFDQEENLERCVIFVVKLHDFRWLISKKELLSRYFYWSLKKNCIFFSREQLISRACFYSATNHIPLPKYLARTIKIIGEK